jgi:hypothetical protein
MAASTEDLQRLLDVAYAWGQATFMRFSPKSYAMQLAGPHASPTPTEPLALGDLQLPWRADPTPYLGFVTLPHNRPAGPVPRREGKYKVPLDGPKLQRNLVGFRLISSVRPGQPYLVYPALRFAVDQVIHGAALYCTALLDTNLASLGQQVVAHVRAALRLPSHTPTAFIRWELRLQHPALRAAHRGIMAMANIWHRQWFGRQVLQPLWHADPDHPLFKVGTLARARRLVQQAYPATRFDPNPLAFFADIREDLSDPTKRANFRENVADALGQVFHSAVLQDADRTRGLPRCLQEDLVAYITTSSDEPLTPPLFLYEPYDLNRAGVLFHLPVLAQHFRSDLQDMGGRPPCAWCHAPNAEWGRHLLVCPKTPPHLVAMRNLALLSIYTDVDPKCLRHDDHPLSSRNLNRLYFLRWQGTSSRCKHRPDAGGQPAVRPLRQALWYMRTCINAYSSAAGHHPCPAGTTQGSERVPRLPVYGRSPFGAAPDP